MPVKTSSSEDKNPVKTGLGLGGSTISWKPGNLGDAMGMAFRAQANPLGEAAKNVKQTPASMGSVTGTRSQQQAADRNQYLAEQRASQALASAGGNGGGGGGSSYDPTAAYREQSAKDRARMEALYAAYAAQIAGNEAGINTNYGASGATLGDIYGKAASSTNAGYDALRAAQTEQLKALGLTGGAPSESFGAQLASAGRYTNLGSASQALNEAQRQAAIANNQAIVGSIQGEQRGALSDFDRMTQENIVAQQQAAQAAAAANAAAQARAQAQAAENERNWQYKYDVLASKASSPIDYQTILNEIQGGAQLTPEQAAYANWRRNN